MINKGICTIVSKNYIAQARTLVDSYLEHHPDEYVFVLLVDKVEGFIDKENEKYTLIELEELDNINDIYSFCFKYNILELNTAVKPFFLEYLFKKYNLDKLVYFDPDIMIMRPIDKIFDILDENSIIITPHITKPIEIDEFSPCEMTFLKAGTYNLGFIAMSCYEKVKRVLKWWQERLYYYCISDFGKGLFVDQKWIDLLPSLFDDIYILRGNEFNVAYWNLHERTITFTNNKFYSNDKEIVFFHFSGFDINLNEISKYQNRFNLKNNKSLFELFNLYRDKLVQNEYFEASKWPYYYNKYSNGEDITDIERRIYYLLPQTRKQEMGNPFIVDHEKSFYCWYKIENGERSSLLHLLDGKASIYHLYYNLTNKWIKNKNKGKTIVDYLKKLEIESIAIYGNGELGKRLYEELVHTDIKISCFIDKNTKEVKGTENNISVIGVNELKKMSFVDAIIVTPIYDFEIINTELRNTKLDFRILSLEDIVYALEEEN